MIVPLLVLCALKPRARNPRDVKLDELFLAPSEQTRTPPRAPHQSAGWFGVFALIDALLRHVERFFPQRLRRRAIDRAVAFLTERLHGESGLGAIFPAMVNTVEMFDALGVPATRADVATARRAIDLLLVTKGDETYCQPCVSPVWDTALACHALLETDTPKARAAAWRGCCPCRCWTWVAIGSPAVPTCRPAIGPFNTPIPIIWTSTTLR